jgi:soluble cytochrome b562
LNNYLSKLKINCDYASRGCLKFTCVGDLKTHVANCRFAPVLCSNENCGTVIDKQEAAHHETVVCEYKKAKCHDCGLMQEVVERLEGRLTELDWKVEAESEEMKKSKYEIKQEHEEDKKEVGEVKKEVKDVKENLSKLNNDMDQIKVMMNQLVERLLANKLPSPTDGMLNAPREDILIAGGYGGLSKTGKNTVLYSWEKNGWFEVSQMNEKHITASAFIYNDLLFVVGGIDSKTIETLDLNHLPLKWMKFIGELPYKCDDHQTVVYQQRVIHIGGYNYGQKRRSNMISELQLTSPCTMNELREMPEPRVGHCAEIFEEKILIVGGEDHRGALDGVLELDPKKNECKEMPPLPLRLARMATVRWRDQVVVLGGRDRDGRILNDVFMYDCKTGKITALPRMLEERYGCCAVITGNTIVVMGGENINANEKVQTLNSVECFRMGGSTWKYLTAMNEARWGAVAAVLPSTRKYV